MKSMYKSSHPSMYDDYVVATRPPKVPNHHMALKGCVLNAVTNEPIQNVTISINNNGTYRRGGTMGKYQFQNLPNGEHTISFSKNGFVSQTHDVLIPDEETLCLDILLHPSEN
ncbi:MAG: carboxypeptidase-like regulatory domain-containing protein [Bacteroidales bacterium]|nr:carboxypeptidase-like regulatory domain-containing protein [Bacteroidales bacterium]